MTAIAGPEALPRIERDRLRWRTKPSLRLVYDDYRRRISKALVDGPVLEIGGGSGNLKESLPKCVSIDVQWAPWLDIVADAHRLPFADAAFANIVMLDVFHHLIHPMVFLREALRVLKPGGRLVMIEPNVSPVSWFFFKLLHEEPVDLRQDPFSTAPQSGPSPYDSNQAIPYLMFVRQRKKLEKVLPQLRVRGITRFSLWAYPLSGGFQPWTLLPRVMVKPLLTVEEPLTRLIGSLAGFRLQVVAEKQLV